MRDSKAAQAIRAALADGERAYWDLINFDADNSKAGALAGRNAQRALDALITRGVVRVDDDGYCTLTDGREVEG